MEVQPLRAEDPAGKDTALQGKRELGRRRYPNGVSQACPTQAIIFGDLKDPNSRVFPDASQPAELPGAGIPGHRPNIGYLKKVRNPLETT